MWDYRNLYWPPLLLALALGGTTPLSSTEGDLETLVERLDTEDLFSRQKAEVEIRKKGASILVPLAKIYSTSDLETTFRLRAIFEDLLEGFLDEFEKGLLAVAYEKAELQLLKEQLKKENPQTVQEEIAERIKNMTERLTEQEPRVEEDTKFLQQLVPAALETILRRREFVLPHVKTHYETLLDEALEETELDVKPEDPSFQRLRYSFGPLWFWAAERETANAKEIEPLLGAHIASTFDDLLSPDYRVRERAEDIFFILGKRGVEYLKSRRPDRQPLCERLIDLLRWRIHPRTRARTSMDFRDYESMDFRQRRQHIIRYARTAGHDAIPTLRLLVYDNSRESSIRLKLTAAEALAGLGDSAAIQELSRRQIPELLRIPEISREFFLLKGIQFQEEKKYDLAIKEFKSILDESPFHFEANYRIGFVYLLTKDYKRSIHHFVIALRVRPGDMLTLYNLACAYSLSRAFEKALENLEKSVEAGFSDHAHIESDPDLTPLRDRPRFQKLLTKLKELDKETETGDRE